MKIMDDSQYKSDIYHLSGGMLANLLFSLSFISLLCRHFPSVFGAVFSSWFGGLPYDFALGFLFFSAALIQWRRRRLRAAGHFALLTALWGMAILFTVFFFATLPVGCLLGSGTEIPETERLAVLLGAVSLVICGTGFVLGCHKFNPVNFIGSAGAIVFSQGIIFAFGYLYRDESGARVAELLALDGLNTLAILLAGSGLLLAAARLVRQRRGVVPRWLPLWAGVTVLVIGICLWETMLILENHQIAQVTRQTGEAIRMEMVEQLEVRCRKLRHLSDPFRPDQLVAKSLQMSVSELFVSMVWVDKDFRVQMRFPETGKARGAGLHPVTLMPPGNGERGQQGGFLNLYSDTLQNITMCQLFVPVAPEGRRPGGFLGGTFYAGALFQNLPNFLVHQYSIHIGGPQGNIYVQNFSRAAPGLTQTVPFEYLGYPFRIELWPAPAMLQRFQSRFSKVILLMAVLFGVCTTLIAWFAQTAHYRARRIAIAQQEEAQMLKLLRSSQKKMLERSRQLEQINKEMAVEMKQRWQVEQRLWENERRLQTILNTAAEGILTVNGDGRIESVNRMAEEIFHCEAAAVMGQPLSEIIPTFQPRLAPESALPDWPVVLKKMLNETHEMVGRRGDGSMFPIEVSISEVALEKNVLYTAIIRDITRRKHSEEQLRTYARVLERHNRELQEFATIASHDLQEPLRKIRAFCDRLQRRGAGQLDQNGQEYLRRIQSAAERMQELLDAWLKFSHITTRAQPFSTVDLHRITREVIGEFQGEIEALKGRVEVVGLSTIEADAQQMRQLIRNLVQNAMKFHKKDQQPMIKIQGRIMKTGNRLLSEFSQPYQFMEITVSDNGIGFDEKYSTKIFSVFQRLHSRAEYHGTGIGLSICQKIVERHGGYIRVKSRPGEGTQFVVTLPVKQTIQEEEKREIPGQGFE